MVTDIPPTAAITDGDKHLFEDINQSTSHSLFQEAAGLWDKLPTRTKVEAIAIDLMPTLLPAIAIGEGLFKSYTTGGATGKDVKDIKDAGPTVKERGDAEKTLEGLISKLVPEADRETMKAMTTAITNGDTKAFAEAVKKAGGDPQKLRALVEEVDKMLKENHSSARLDVTGDGKVLVSDTGRGTALAFDPKTGNVEAKSVQQNFDGTVLVQPGELLHVDVEETFKEMADRAVDSLNGKGDPIFEKKFPFLGPALGGPLVGPGMHRDHGDLSNPLNFGTGIQYLDTLQKPIAKPFNNL